jgi:glycerol uptake facilitator-like aquaporin
MEVEGGHENKKWILWYELIGTALLAASINFRNSYGASTFAKSTDGTISAYAPPFTLFTIIMMFGSVSGGHFNPAVSTAVFVWHPNKAKNIRLLPLLMVMQILGAFIGCLLTLGITNGGAGITLMDVTAP